VYEKDASIEDFFYSHFPRIHAFSHTNIKRGWEIAGEIDMNFPYRNIS
jgi:hypothetical protein